MREKGERGEGSGRGLKLFLSNFSLVFVFLEDIGICGLCELNIEMR